MKNIFEAKNIFNAAARQIDEPKIRLSRVWQIEQGLGFDSGEFPHKRATNEKEYLAVRTTAGKGVFQMWNGDEFVVTAHTVLIVKITETQRWYCKEADWVCESYTFETEDASNLDINHVRSIDITETERRISGDCFAHLGSKSYQESAYAQNLFKSLLALWHIEPERQSIRNINIEYTLDYVTRMASSKVTVSQIAERLNMSKQKLRRMFLTYTGLTPKQYMEEKRMKTALDLLEASTMTIKEIAVHCGFYDQFHFNRRFKEKFGYSPKTVRNKPTDS